MKKTLFLATAVAALSLFASCDRNKPEDPNTKPGGNDSTIVVPGDTIVTPGDTVVTPEFNLVAMVEELASDTTASHLQAVAAKYGWVAFTPQSGIAILVDSPEKLALVAAAMNIEEATYEQMKALAPVVVYVVQDNTLQVITLDAYPTFTETWEALKPASDYAFENLYGGVYWTTTAKNIAEEKFIYAEGDLITTIDSTYSGPYRTDMLTALEGNGASFFVELMEMGLLGNSMSDAYAVEIAAVRDGEAEDAPILFFQGGYLRIKSLAAEEEPVEAPKLLPLNKLLKK